MPKPAATRAFLIYNAWRLGLFVGCAVLLALAGLRGFILLVAALLVSGVLSYFLLDRQRRALAESLGEAVDRSRRKMAERTEREDAYVDEMLARQRADAGEVAGEVTRSDR
ncbi:MAG: DUF4229 domain-containing protein [Frankiaceae bacterium]|nr:DUF4229 domain-containing protein [Frankiaceae bacterium]MBV9369967.1 DUF4229 domain-containing protein [Frankiales bacterium]